MREINIKEFVSRNRNACVLLIVFPLALLLGFSGEKVAELKTDRARYQDLYNEMRRVMRILEPVLKPDVISTSRSKIEAPAKELAGMVERGIIGQLPDGSWNIDAVVTRGEALFYFARMLRAFEMDLIYPPKIIEIAPSFVDVFVGHWLYESLPRLAGIGALEYPGQRKLSPDAVVAPDELRKIGSAMIDYLGSNLLIVKFDGRSGQLLTKGALHEIKLAEWNYSCNRRDWFQVGANGLLEPEFSGSRVDSLFFRHPSYREAGPIMLKENVPSIGMIKLQRNYADFSRNRLNAGVNNAKADSGDEKERIRQRLAQLLKRSQLKKTDENRMAWAATGNDSAGSLKNELISENTAAIEPSSFCNTKDQEVAGELYDARIVDALSKEPLRGAVLIIASRQYTADNEGKVSFTADNKSVVDLTAYSEGYEALKLRHRVGYRDGPITLSLKPVFSSCAGTITSFPGDLPVSRALIRIGSRATRSSTDGRFAIKGIRPGYHQVSVVAENYLEAHEIAHIGTKPGQTINMRLRPAGDDNVFAANYQ